MNLCGEMKTASRYGSSGPLEAEPILISMYGAAAAKSQKERAPYRWSRTEIARQSLMMPVTLEAAEKLPIFRGRSRWRASSNSRWRWSIWPSWSS